MRITISARNCVVSGSVRHQTERRLRRLARFEPRLLAAEVHFGVARGIHRAEARVFVPGEPAIAARGSGESFRAAVGQTADRVRRQLKSRRGRRRDHQASRPPRVLTPAGGA